MNLSRETILAAVAGLGVGLLAAWAVWSLPNVLPQKKAPTEITEKEIPASETVAEAFNLTLSQPENDALVETNQVTVTGKTSKGTTVVVNGPLKDEIVTARNDGSFSVTMTLEEGVNEIIVTAYDKTGTEKSETRTVNYTKEQF